MPKKRFPDDVELIALSLRLPLDLKAQLEDSARRNRRSVNQEAQLWLEVQAQALGLRPAAAPPPSTSAR